MSAREASIAPASESFLSVAWRRLKSWEGLLLVILLVILAINSSLAPGYLTINNQINLFVLSIEKIMIALTMTFLIINGEIDLSAPVDHGPGRLHHRVLLQPGRELRHGPADLANRRPGLRYVQRILDSRGSGSARSS